MNFSYVFMPPVHLILLVIFLCTLNSKIIAETATKKNEKEPKATARMRSNNSNDENSVYLTWPGAEETTLKRNSKKQLTQRQRRNAISGFKDLLSDTHHNDKRSVLVFKQQVLEVQVPDDQLTGKQIPKKYQHKTKHHKGITPGLSFFDKALSHLAGDKDDVKHDNKENLNILIKKTSHKDPLGNKLEEIHSDTDKVIVSKVASASPFQDIPGIEHSNGFVNNNPEQMSGYSNNLNFVNHEEVDRNNQIFNPQGEGYEDIQRFVDQPYDFLPPEIDNNNHFHDTNSHPINNLHETHEYFPEMPLQYPVMNLPAGETVMDYPHVQFPAEITNQHPIYDSSIPQLKSFPEADRHDQDMSLKYSNYNPESLHPSDYNINNKFTGESHEIFPPENGNNFPFEETVSDDRFTNKFHGPFPHENGNKFPIQDSIPDENIGNRYMDKSADQFHPENGNNIPFVDTISNGNMGNRYMDQPHDPFPHESGLNIPFGDTMSDGKMGNGYMDQPLDPFPHESGHNVPFGDTMPGGNMGNRYMDESHDLIHPENGNNILSKETDQSFQNNFPENNPHLPSLSYRYSNGNPENMMPSEGEIVPHSHVGETLHEVIQKEEKIQEINSQSGNNEVSREISKETSNTVSRKVEDSKSLMTPEHINDNLQEVPHESMNFRLGDEHSREHQSYNSPWVIGQEPYEHYHEVPQIYSAHLKRNDQNEFENPGLKITNLHHGQNFNTLSDSSIRGYGNYGEVKNNPMSYEEIKNHPIDLGEIKNYPYIDIKKSAQNNDQDNRNNLLEIFFTHDNQQIPETRERKQVDFHNHDDSRIKNLDNFKRDELKQLSKNPDSDEKTEKFLPTSSSTESSSTKKTEKRDGFMKQVSEFAEATQKNNLLYIRKRTVEILLPKASSKSKRNATSNQENLPILGNGRNEFPNYQQQNQEGNDLYRPKDKEYSESKNFEDPNAFLVPQQSNTHGASGEYLNYPERNPNSDLYIKESSPITQNKFNMPPQENLRNLPLTEEDAEAYINKRETPVNAETIISQFIDMSSNKIKRNTSSLPEYSFEAPRSRRMKKSHKKLT